jgi:hypothetical protein
MAWRHGPRFGIHDQGAVRRDTQEVRACDAAYGSADPRLGRGTALGCAGQARTHALVLVHRAWRIHPVAGGALGAASTARCGALR